MHFLVRVIFLYLFLRLILEKNNNIKIDYYYVLDYNFGWNTCS